MENYDVIVIGGGHAGCEAALSSARTSTKTLLVTINMDGIACMPFGGSIGGTAENQLVREIDNLGGEISKNTDKNYINMRSVEDYPGSCKKAITAVVDRRRYFLSMKEVLEKQKNLELRQGLAVEVKKNKGKINLFLSDETVFTCNSLIICAGTFFRGKIKWGDNLIAAGRQGEINSKRFPLNLERLNLKFRRVKEFTAPVIDRKTIDLNRLEREPFDRSPEMFSTGNSFNGRVQLNNYIGYTDKKFIRYIFQNIKGREELKGGEGNSVEERVLKTENKKGFRISFQFMGRDTNEIYLHGLETMLREDIQEKMITRIKGLEKAQITRPGYAVEYDCLTPSQIKYSLESKELNGIFFAGKINGTKTYEESAAQGIVAGINASGKVKGIKGFSKREENVFINMLLNKIAAGKQLDEKCFT